MPNAGSVGAAFPDSTGSPV